MLTQNIYLSYNGGVYIYINLKSKMHVLLLTKGWEFDHIDILQNKYIIYIF